MTREVLLFTFGGSQVSILTSQDNARMEVWIWTRLGTDEPQLKFDVFRPSSSPHSLVSFSEQKRYAETPEPLFRSVGLGSTG